MLRITALWVSEEIIGFCSRVGTVLSSISQCGQTQDLPEVMTDTMIEGFPSSEDVSEVVNFQGTVSSRNVPAAFTCLTPQDTNPLAMRDVPLSNAEANPRVGPIFNENSPLFKARFDGVRTDNLLSTEEATSLFINKNAKSDLASAIRLALGPLPNYGSGANVVTLVKDASAENPAKVKALSDTFALALGSAMPQATADAWNSSRFRVLDIHPVKALSDPFLFALDATLLQSRADAWSDSLRFQFLEIHPATIDASNNAAQALVMDQSRIVKAYMAG